MAAPTRQEEAVTTMEFIRPIEKFVYSESFDTEFDTNASTDISTASTTVERVVHVRKHVPSLEERPRPGKADAARNYGDIRCPPSLIAQIRESQLQKTIQNTAEQTSDCMERSFDAFPAKGSKKNSPSFMARLASPCHPADTANAILLGAEKGIDACIAPDSEKNKQQQQKQQREIRDRQETPVRQTRKVMRSPSRPRPRRPPTPPTSGSSCSEGEDYQSCSGSNSILAGSSSHRSVARKKGRDHKQVFADPAEELDNEEQEGMGDIYHSPLPSNCDLIFLVGNEQFVLLSSSLKLSLSSLRHLMKSGTKGQPYTVDLTTHSSEEWMIVLSFLKSFSGSRDLDWRTLPVILPWIADFQVATILSEIDSFLLHSILGSGLNRAEKPSFQISNLILLTKVACIAGLECIKSQAQRLLRLRLLKPSKPAIPVSTWYEMESGEIDNELAWTLDDLQALASMMERFEDLRGFLWEYAVIVYLPHDLDISDSLTLVANPLFPYLLREGMMQMMIVEGMESANNSTELQDTPMEDSTVPLNRKLSKNPTMTDGTTCSATTIPTKPGSTLEVQTQEEIQHCLQRIVQHWEKYQVEKEMLALMPPQVSESESSLSADDMAKSPKSIKHRRRVTSASTPYSPTPRGRPRSRHRGRSKDKFE